MLKTILVSLLSFLPFFSFAETQAVSTSLQPKVYLERLQVKETGEKRGDEIYLHVTVYKGKDRPTLYQIPGHPLHWQSKNVEKINHLKVWDGQLANQEAVTLALALIEHDMPPWNTDDLIGTVRVKLYNNNGQLLIQWMLPDTEKGMQTTVVENTKTVHFDNEHGRYEMVLSATH